MSTTDAKLEKFKEQFLIQLDRTAYELRAGNWLWHYDKETDEFVWRNPNASPSDDSAMIAIDHCLNISVNKNSAEIEFFFVQNFVTQYIQENPELKAFGKAVSRIDSKHSLKEYGSILDNFFGKMIGPTPNFSGAIG